VTREILPATVPDGDNSSPDVPLGTGETKSKSKYIRKTPSDENVTYQCEAAGKNHCYDEGLEVAVLDEFVHVATARPPDTTSHCGAHRVTAMTVFHTYRRTALVRVLDEDDVHLYASVTTVDRTVRK